VLGTVVQLCADIGADIGAGGGSCGGTGSSPPYDVIMMMPTAAIPTSPAIANGTIRRGTTDGRVVLATVE